MTQYIIIYKMQSLPRVISTSAETCTPQRLKGNALIIRSRIWRTREQLLYRREVTVSPLLKHE